MNVSSLIDSRFSVLVKEGDEICHLWRNKCFEFLTLCQCLHLLENKSGRGDNFSREHNFLLFGEIVSPTGLLFQYMKALTNSEKIKEFIAPNMTDLITFIDKNGKSAVYDGGEIHGIYR